MTYRKEFLVGIPEGEDVDEKGVIGFSVAQLRDFVISPVDTCDSSGGRRVIEVGRNSEIDDVVFDAPHFSACPWFR